VLDGGLDIGRVLEPSRPGAVVVAPPLGIVGPVGAGTTDDEAGPAELDVVEAEAFAVLEDDVEAPPARVDDTSDGELVVAAVVVDCACATPVAPPSSAPTKASPSAHR
jgi:hypothetical protein